MHPTSAQPLLPAAIYFSLDRKEPGGYVSAEVCAADLSSFVMGSNFSSEKELLVASDGNKVGEGEDAFKTTRSSKTVEIRQPQLM